MHIFKNKKKLNEIDDKINLLLQNQSKIVDSLSKIDKNESFLIQKNVDMAEKVINITNQLETFCCNQSNMSMVITELNDKFNTILLIKNQIDTVANSNNEGHEYVKSALRDILNCIFFLQEKAQILNELENLQEVRMNNILAYCNRFHVDEWKKEYFNRVRQLTRTWQVNNDQAKFVRLGKKYDGGYVMLEPLLINRIAYSIGINNDVSWDKDIATNYDYEIYQYDHTIDCLPEYNEYFHWEKIGLSSADCENMMTLETMLKKNGHFDLKDMILKIDIEGSEWNVLEKIDSDILKKFDQIIIEFHDLLNFQTIEKKITVLEKINETHAAVHVHANNYGLVCHDEFGIVPDVLEVTYVNRKNRTFIERKNWEDNKLNNRNCSFISEIELGTW